MRPSHALSGGRSRRSPAPFGRDAARTFHHGLVSDFRAGVTGRVTTERRRRFPAPCVRRVRPAVAVLSGLLAAGPPAALSARGPEGVPEPRVRAEAAIVFDAASGNAVWEHNAREPRPIASITKVMTVMLFLDEEPDLDRDVVVSRRDVRNASTTWLRRGERVSLRDLVHLALVASDNVAARVLARASRWGTRRFISRMNAMAAELGLEHTRFTDPSGLHEGNVSSAHDVSRLIAAAGRQPGIARILRKRSYRFRTSRQNGVIRNTNRLLGVRPDVVGGKTGYINAAGYCLATLIRVGDRAVSVVVLGAGSNGGRFRETRRLADWLVNEARALLAPAAD